MGVRWASDGWQTCVGLRAGGSGLVATPDSYIVATPDSYIVARSGMLCYKII